VNGTRPLVLVAAALSLLAASSIPRSRPVLLWNASASVPVGLYRTRPPRGIGMGDLVVVRPPARLADFLDCGGYLPAGVPLLKRVAALPGQRVCRTGSTVSIDGRSVAHALKKDRRGRPLPVWSGCLVLDRRSVFLLNSNRPDSLDGRYFGALSSSTVVARAIPVWTEGGQR